ncbi:AAA family ATPase [Kineothrix sp. MB12-C1]|uniref:AAA family ATPase n=1 Tax=Kineothrix sp. MB12-C1 TaxID=3070215 RepID=UPI0027D2F475|nr:AAA family ATPase [Kineothrix sp. MB12-C1]WMC94008.1 AAA family ATPase [Kineothrix sp. MB12-C1]
MSDEQKNVDDGKRWQIDYDYNLVWDQTIKSQVNLESLKRLFAYAEKCYEILPGSYDNSEGPYYRINMKSKDDWNSDPQMDRELEKDFHENINEYNIAFLTVQKDTRENGKKGDDKVVTSNLKDHTNSVKLRCQGNLYYEKLVNKTILARYSFVEGESVDKSLYIAFPEEVIGDGQKSYRVSCRNLHRARKYGIFSDPDSELKEVIFTAENIGIYFANREMLHGIKRIQSVALIEETEESEEENIFRKYAYNRIVFGAPGTGKSHRLEKNSELFKENYERVTFHPNYSYAQFVGTYKPVQGVGETEIRYEYVPGPFMRIYTKALNNPNENYLLLIEEINRANIAAVFGDIFQLLDRKKGISEYRIGTSKDIRNHLLKTLYDKKLITECDKSQMEQCTHMCIPRNMFIWATMNSADQGVFPMDTAFKRRWEFEYIGIDEEEDEVTEYVIPIGIGENRKYVYWNELRKRINSILSQEENRINEDKLLGPFFISKSVLENALRDEEAKDNFVKSFESKVIMYLFEDVMKMRPEKIFPGCKERKLFSKICEAFETDGEKIFGISDLQYVEKTLQE